MRSGALSVARSSTGVPVAAGYHLGAEVPDPYYGGDGGFAEVLDMVEAAMPGLPEWAQVQL